MTAQMTIADLASRHCVPCKGAEPMGQSDAKQILRVLPGWALRDGLIEKEFRFGSYRDGLEFAYKVGRIAEEQDHHPDIVIRWRHVKLTFTTHVIKGLSMNDFIMAAKAELEYQKHSSR